MLTRLALRARIVVIVLMIAVMAGGAYSLSKLKIELLPDFDFPVVTISAFYPSAGPQQVLNDVTAPIENALQGAPNIVSVHSTSAPSIAQIVILSDFGKDIKALEAEVTRRVHALSLPAGVQPRVARINPDEFPVLEISVIGSSDITQLADMVQKQVLPVIERVPGVASAEVPVGIVQGLSITRTNGQPSVPISVLKAHNANTVEVSDAVTKRLEQLKPALPGGTDFVEISNQAPGIQRSINELTSEVILGAILAVAVIFAFLLSVRPTLVTSISIPVSVLAALVVMAWQGMSLNILTLGGLAIAVGRVVDDSIVVMENTFRHVQQGESPGQAALNATREVAVPITTSTLTTIAVFVPLVLIGGFISVIFLPFALTVTYALLASLLVALTVVPVLASIFIGKARPHTVNRLERSYTGLLGWALVHRGRTILIAVGFIVGSLFLVRFIPISFLPNSGEAILSVQMTVPGVPTREQVLAQLDEVEAVLVGLKNDGTVTAYRSTYGNTGEFRGANARANTANIVVRLLPDADAETAAQSLRQNLAGPSRTVRVSASGGGGPSSDALELVLKGNDYAALTDTADRLTAELQKLDGLVNVTNDANAGSALIASAPVTHVDGERAVTISGTITARNTQAIQAQVQQAANRVGLSPGVELVTGGVFADINRTFRQMGIAMLAGVLLVYVVMVFAQRSFVTPFVIVLSLPLATIGALGALFITQRALGLPALIGLLMLVGLVVTNAIVLIAFVEQLRMRGLPMREALLQGGRTRLRPILMTAFTTIFVLLPLALGLGGQSAGIIGAELATVVIGGLITSTFLTLVVIPVAYTYLRRKGPKPQAVAIGRVPSKTG
ncbi:MAG: efflux RND transporter permease subunit [Chloroflexi bacterium]|nr:efflux RND transporter permease subunit [Chloroflexota bacterium]